jgi:hypothetical protein
VDLFSPPPRYSSSPAFLKGPAGVMHRAGVCGLLNPVVPCIPHGMMAKFSYVQDAIFNKWSV